jgi:hypothetical protein
MARSNAVIASKGQGLSDVELDIVSGGESIAQLFAGIGQSVLGASGASEPYPSHVQPNTVKLGPQRG